MPRTRLLNFDRPFYPALINWLHTPELLESFAGSQFNFPLTANQLDRFRANSDRYCYLAFTYESSHPYGYGELYTTEHSAVISRVFIGHAEWKGIGLGQELVQLLVDKATKDLSKQQVEIYVLDWNQAAIRSYESLGFVQNPSKTIVQEVNGEPWMAVNMYLKK
jgi:RimJ/RimL family protein N-acetyltransferase